MVEDLRLIENKAPEPQKKNKKKKKKRTRQTSHTKDNIIKRCLILHA